MSVQLAEFRGMMEGHISAQAAKTADLDDLEKLKNILRDALFHIKTDPSGWKEFHKLDAKFHRTLAEIGQNPLIDVNLSAVHDNIQIYFHQYLPWSRALLKENYEDLCNIVNAIELKDSKSARRLAVGHVIEFNELMEKNLDG